VQRFGRLTTLDGGVNILLSVHLLRVNLIRN